MAACHPSRSDTCLCWLTLHRFMQSQNNNHGNPWNTKFVYFRMNALNACGSWGPIKPVWIWNHFLERKQPCRKPNQRTCILLLTSPDLDKFKFSQNNKTLTDQILIKFTTYSRKPTVFSDLFFSGGAPVLMFVNHCLSYPKEHGAMKGCHLPIQIVAAKVPIIDDAPGPPAFENHREGEQVSSQMWYIRSKKTSYQTLWYTCVYVYTCTK